jgi:hypothetical protein
MQPAPQPRPRVRVEWKTFDQLEVSLRELQRVYAESPAQRRELREAVIRAKDRARFASRNPKAAAAKRAQKAEMVRWMLVWLDNPAMFGEWVILRRKQLDPAIL